MAITLDGNNLLTSGMINSSIAQSSTSGTSITFTGIPSTAKRITIIYSGVSTNGTSPPIAQAGTSGGFVTSGYIGGGGYGGTSSGGGNTTVGFAINGVTWDANATANGSTVLYNISGSTWVSSTAVGQSDSGHFVVAGSSVTLSGLLTQLRVTTINGTDTFDAGSINIFYE